MIEKPYSCAKIDGSWFKITRGPIPGAGKWSHEYADTGNTACSDDTAVKGQLGVLWYGLPGPGLMVERHARPPAPVAGDGKMFVQGENVVMAYDAYNGNAIWQKEIPGAVRVRVDSDMGNLALADSGIYVAADDKCLRLDKATGETVKTYALPDSGSDPKRWGYIACTGDTLFGTVSPPFKEDYGELWEELSAEGDLDNIDEIVAKRNISPEYKDRMRGLFAGIEKADERAFWSTQYTGAMWRFTADFPAWGSVQAPESAITERIMAGDKFFAYDTESGKLLWQYDKKSIAHPAIAIGDGLVFIADCEVTPEQRRQAAEQRAELIAKGVWTKDEIEYKPEAADVRHIAALDARTGAVKWERVMDLTGCGGDRMGLAYKNGTLCFLGCFSNHDRNLFKEGKLKWRRITAVAGKDGADIWSRPLNYLRRPVIVNDTILIEPRACDLMTGDIKMRTHPLTGEQVPWEYVRPGHCCSATSACPNMFFLRGYFLWYYDLANDFGMIPFGAVRPGCWINVVPANGVVLFPEASAGCTCSYPIRSTVVLKPIEEKKKWATFVQHGDLTPVRHMAVNFGAPGDWRDDDGVLWCSYPHPPKTEWHPYGLDFVLNEQFADGGQFVARNYQAPPAATSKPWIFASGAQGLKKFEVPLLRDGQPAGKYTLRFYMTADSGPTKLGIAIQGAAAEECIVPEGAGAALIKEFNGIDVKNSIQVELTPAPGAALPIINGFEAIREDQQVASR
jgi:outer membrane protein assembly factor BamB